MKMKNIDVPMETIEIFDMKEELEALFHRPVDFVTKEGLRNPFRRHEILTNRQVLYAAAGIRGPHKVHCTKESTA